MNNYNIIKKLLFTIDLNLLNKNIIKKNCHVIINLFKILKNIWFKNYEKNNLNPYLINNNSLTFNKIITIFNTSILSNYKLLFDFVNDNHNDLYCIKNNNVEFYYLINSRYDTTKKENIHNKALYMFKITMTLHYYKYPNNNINNDSDSNNKIKKRIIIWIPINKKRDFREREINDNNLCNCYKNFEAFTVSGLTYGDDERISIITRIEDINKLLIHELIHNYYLDGSNNIDEMNDIIKKYEIIKKSNNNFDYTYSIYESYTELMSSYLYIIFKNIDISVNDFNNKIYLCIIIEIIYSYNTIANLINLNNYTNYNDFINKKYFKSNICIYEYYYIKAIMYNNFIFRLGSTKDFIEIYQDIINLIYTINKNDDLLLYNIFTNYIKQCNFRYMLIQ